MSTPISAATGVANLHPCDATCPQCSHPKSALEILQILTTKGINGQEDTLIASLISTPHPYGSGCPQCKQLKFFVEFNGVLGFKSIDGPNKKRLIKIVDTMFEDLETRQKWIAQVEARAEIWEMQKRLAEEQRERLRVMEGLLQYMQEIQAKMQWFGFGWVIRKKRKKGRVSEETQTDPRDFGCTSSVLRGGKPVVMPEAGVHVVPGGDPRGAVVD